MPKWEVISQPFACLDPGCWSIIWILPFTIQAEERADFIVAAEGATPRNRSGGDQVNLIFENRLRQAIWRASTSNSTTEGARGIDIP